MPEENVRNDLVNRWTTATINGYTYTDVAFQPIGVDEIQALYNMGTIAYQKKKPKKNLSEDEQFVNHINNMIHSGMEISEEEKKRYARIVKHTRHLNRDERRVFHSPKIDSSKSTASVSVDDLVMVN